MSTDSLSRFCSECGGKLKYEDKFCGTCGVSRSDALGEFDPRSLEENHVDSLHAEESQKEFQEEFEYLDPPSEVIPSKKLIDSWNGWKWIGGISAALVIIIMIAVSGNNNSQENTVTSVQNTVNTPSPSDTPSETPTPSHTSKPTPKPTHSVKPIDQCVINDQTILDLVTLKNAAATAPTGSNDASHRALILNWATSASDTARTLNDEGLSAQGKVASQIASAANELSNLSSLATAWANNALTNPSTFASQYTQAIQAVNSAYAALVSTCGSKLPG